MDTLAIIVLIAATVAFAYLAHHWHCEAHALRQSLDSLSGHITNVRKLAYDDGFLSGLKRGYGDMFTAMRKAEHEGRDPVAAAAAVGRMTEEPPTLIQV